MPPIQVETFTPPHGRTENITVELPPDIFLKAEKILADGFVFQVEILRTHQLSWTITHNELGDMAFNITGPLVGHTEAVTKLIREFDI